jgi:outer membrane protein assembly factor BamA
MLKKYFFVATHLLLSTFGYAGEMPDSVAVRRSSIIIPFASYQQETSIAPGIAFGHYFKSNDFSKISSVSGSVVYTFLNQFTLDLTPKLFFSSNNWYLYSNLNFRKYPDIYYGISNKATNFKQPFTSFSLSMLLEPQYSISKHFLIGALFSSRSERVTGDSAYYINKSRIFTNFGSSGWEPYSVLSLGIVTSYDNRDNQFYPQRGFFAKASFSVSGTSFGSSYSLQELKVDLRQYISLFGSHVLAWQAYYNGIFGTKGIPFELLPTIGGSDILRGFRQGMYRDNVMFAVQSEYRFPIYNRLKAAIFCSLGDVMNSSDYRIDKLKVSYGAGLRYRLNDARVHLRLDCAKNNYDNKLQFYITATEAF